MKTHLLKTVIALAAGLSAGTSYSQDFRPNRPSLPQVALDRAAHGEAAIQALANNLPDVARHYGMTAERLSELLRKDGDLWVDPSGRLHFADSHVPNHLPPDPENSVATAGGDGTTSGSLYGLDQTFLLHSRASATRKIYLDFNGHTTSGTSWRDIKDGDGTFVTPPFDFDGNSAAFGATEQARIQYQTS